MMIKPQASSNRAGSLFSAPCAEYNVCVHVRQKIVYSVIYFVGSFWGVGMVSSLMEIGKLQKL